MQYNFVFNIIDLVITACAWVVIGILFIRLYKKKTEKPTIWKALIITYLGIFSFSINLPIFETIVKFAVLPLGVWIMSFFFGIRGKWDRWEVYCSFAWLGFWANYIFIVSTLVFPLLHGVIYPKDQIMTYISSVDHASVISTHPSSADVMVNENALSEKVWSAVQHPVTAISWYDDIRNPEINKKKELFPYQLVGTNPKWGSGITTLIYLEQDGKGMLISTPNGQLYFRTSESILNGTNGGSHHE